MTKPLCFVAVLVGAGAFLGLVCGMIGEEYSSLFSPSWSLLYLGLWFFGALTVVAVTGGLVAVLLRPFILCLGAFALSALAMFATWEISAHSGIAALVYFLVGLLYCAGVSRELKERIRFSPWHLLRTQAVLLVVLVAIGCSSLYSGYAAQVEREGFSIPSAVMDRIVDAVSDHIDSGLTPEQKQESIEQFRQDLEQGAEDTVGRYEGFIPLGVAAIVFMPLTTIFLLLSWIPILLLAGIFPLLTRLGVVKKVTETMEAERLSLE